MNIDRTRFLLIVSAFAVGGAGALGAACTTTDNTTTGNDGGTTGDASGGGDTGTDGNGGNDSGGNDGGTESGSCTGDEGGTDMKCAAALDAGTGCLGTASGNSLCVNYYDDLKPGVADKAFECLQTYPSCESGLSPDGGPPGCGMQAVLTACPDSTNAQICDYIDMCIDAGADAAAFGTKADCIKVLNGFKTANNMNPPSWVTNISQCTTGCKVITECLRGF